MAKVCNSDGTSYAWIDPQGKVYDRLPWGGHGPFAVNYIRETVDESFDEYDYEGATHYLLGKGWIRVANFAAIEVWDEHRPSHAAWKSMARLLTDCVEDYRNFDMFRGFILVSSASNRDSELYSVSDFITKFVGRQESEAFFEKLMSRAAATIKLRQHARTPGVKAFFADYEALTFDNPIDPRERVWSYASDEGERMPLILTALSFTPHHAAPVWFETISSPEGRGKGQASYVLREIARLADKHGVAIWLTPKPFGKLDNSLKLSDLKAWYTRHGWVPQGSVWVRQPITSRVASRWFRTAADACNPRGVSYAWVDPNGKVHPTQHGHEDWAWQYVQRYPDMKQEAELERDAGSVLLFRGWVRFANFTNIGVWSDRTPSPAAWRATAELVVGCAVSNHDVDVFEPLVYIDEMEAGGKAEVYSVSDFVERYADRSTSDRMFDMLMARR